MQPFLTAFEYVCLYTIGAYCQQVYRSLFFLQIMILYFIPYYSRYIHGEHVAVGGRAGAY